MTWDVWGCLEDGCSASPARRRRITYGSIAGRPVPSPELPDHVIRCSRWPEQRAVPNDALQSPSARRSLLWQQQSSRICLRPFTKTNYPVALQMVLSKSAYRVGNLLLLCTGNSTPYGGEGKENFLKVFKIGTFSPEVGQKVLSSDGFIPPSWENEPRFLGSLRPLLPSSVSFFSDSSGSLLFWTARQCPPVMTSLSRLPRFSSQGLYLSIRLCPACFKYFISTHSSGHTSHTNPSWRSPLILPTTSWHCPSSSLLVRFNPLPSKSVSLL